MYKYQGKTRWVVMIGIGLIVGLSNQAFCSSLSDDIYDSFKNVYDKGVSNDYLNSFYSSKYSKDPFGDILSTIEDMSKQPAVAGAKYVEDELKANNCSLSKKKIRGILYYFVPDFKAELSRSVKMKAGDKKNQNFVLDESTVQAYCKEYFVCTKILEYGGAAGIYSSTEATASYINSLKAATPSDITTNCKEFFIATYAKGKANEERMQGVKKSQAGNDKFRNATTDDSPYDIMSDLNAVGGILYEEVSSPIKPVFYNLPVFSNSVQSLSNTQVGSSSVASSGQSNEGENGGSSNKNNSSQSNSVQSNSVSVLGTEKNTSLLNNTVSNKTNNGSNTLSTSSSVSKSLGNLGDIRDGGDLGKSDIKGEIKVDKTEVEGTKEKKKEWTTESVISDIYDELEAGLGSTSVMDKGTLFYGTLCRDESESDSEPEGTVDQGGGGITVVSTVADEELYEDLALPPEEYQEIIDNMLAMVDQYTELPEEVLNQIAVIKSSNGGSVGNNGEDDSSSNSPPSAAEEMEAEAGKIKTCRESCEGLRVDQQASCMMMCACGERNSPVFDPSGHPGLGPIAGIRFCTIPGVDMNFSKGGKKIKSIEEGTKEILGVVDKLSREGKLGIRTQQNNFLDSSTKKMKFYDLVAFSISIENTDIFDRLKKSSKQYEEKTLNIDNQSWQAIYNISNSLQDPSRKNQYRIVGPIGESRKTGSDGLIEDSQADRYVSISEDLDNFLDQQGNFWKQLQTYMSAITQYAEALYAKKG